MGACRVCGDAAGIFKSIHPSCAAIETEDANRRQTIREAKCEQFRQWLIGGELAEFVSVQTALRELGNVSSRNSALEVLASTIDESVLQRRVLSLQALERFAHAAAQFDCIGGWPNRSWHHLVMLTTLAEIAEGKVPQRCDDPGLGFHYERDERLVWVFGGAQYWEDRKASTRTQGYAGLSLRVAPGLYARAGRSVATTTAEGLVPVFEGNLVVTDRALWYQGPHSTMRFYFDELMSMQCMDHGVLLCGSKANARNFAFVTAENEGWFAHDLIAGLSALREVA